MKKIYLLLLMLFSMYGSKGQTLTVPAAYATTLPGSSFTGPLANTPRTYQLLINQSELTALIGQHLTGISFRSSVALSTVNSWPINTTTYSSYNIYLSESVAPANRSLTFANNIVGTQSQVRSGPLVIAPNSYPAGGPLSFGTAIIFTNPYYYNGGHLLLEIRHTGSNGDGRSNDAVPSTNTLFNTVLATAYATSETATSTAFGTGGAVTVRFDYGVVLPLRLLDFYVRQEASGNNLFWETAEETNCAYFEIEKATDGKSFRPAGRITAHNSGNKTNYTYTDNTISSQKIFYRLKMVDQDEACTYSHIIESSPYPAPKHNITITPNPFTDRLSVSLTVAEPGTISICLYDLLGRIQYISQEKIHKGTNAVEAITDQLPPGLYILEIKGLLEKVFKIQKL